MIVIFCCQIFIYLLMGKLLSIMPFDIENLLNRPVADVERKDFFYKADSLKKEFDKSLQSRKENFQVAYKSLLDNLNFFHII